MIFMNKNLSLACGILFLPFALMFFGGIGILEFLDEHVLKTPYENSKNHYRSFGG